MKRKSIVVVLVVSALTLAAISCQKLDTGRFATGPAGPVAVKVLEPIPLDYGELVAATPHPEQAHWVVLWFQKPDKTIAVVLVNVSQGKVLARATIPRR